MDAYTMRKIAPRILLAVIAINLSIYICVAMIEITNIVGRGIGNLLVAPFVGAGNFTFNLTENSGFLAIAEGLGVTAGAGFILGTIVVSIIGLIAGPGGGIGGFLIFTILIPAVLIILAILVTIAIRQGLLIFLTIISPVAFALYILPGTEKYFRQWLDNFVKTLMVYPIIAVIFAVSDIMTVTSAKGIAGTSSTAAAVVALIFAFLPLILIPFSFRFAGGAMATLANAAKGTLDRANKDGGFLKTRQKKYRQDLADRHTMGRAEMAGRANTMASTAGTGFRARARRRMGRRFEKMAHGYSGSVYTAESALNDRVQKERDLDINNGRDDLWRAYTWSGDTENDLRVQNGVEQIRTAGGAWVNKSNYDQMVSRYGEGNASAYQQALSYEMRKATTQEQQDQLVSSFSAAAQNRGFSNSQMSGAWIGAAFANQNENRQWKYLRPVSGATGGVQMTKNGLGLITEVDEKQGAYASSMQNADTWTTMSESVKEADMVLRSPGSHSAGDLAEAQETMTRAARVAHSLGREHPMTDENGQPMRDASGQIIMTSSVGGGAPGRVADEMRAFHKIATEGAANYNFNEDDFGTQQRTDDENQSQHDRQR
jgi:hypothetical protein